MNMSISLCMIVKNEEDFLEGCLESVKGLADEIIIVDTGSEDSTKEIARRFTDKVFDFKWVDDFSETRNFSISKAGSDWILVLDADETISKQDADKIRELSRESDADAFILRCRTYTNRTGIVGLVSAQGDPQSRGAHGYYESELLRFFRNGKGYHFEGRIHETLHKSVVALGGAIRKCDIIIHHHGAVDREGNLDKKDTYISMLKERIHKGDFSEKPEDYVCFELGRELIIRNRHEEAIHYFERALSIREDFNYILGLGGLYLLTERLDDAERLLKKANRIRPGNSSVNENLGIIYSKRGMFSKTIRKFEKAIRLNPRSASAHLNMGIALREMKKPEKMEYYLNRAAELNPAYRERVKNLL